jgi:hypothetical protein
LNIDSDEDTCVSKELTSVICLFYVIQSTLNPDAAEFVPQQQSAVSSGPEKPLYSETS